MITIIISLALYSPSALAGNELGNGGDSFALDFVATGHRIVEDLRANPDPRIPEAFVQAVDSTKVNSAEKLELEGHEVDALNFPQESRIELSRARWTSYDTAKKRALVLHEYLGICCSKSDHNYEISSSYTLEESPEIRGAHPIDAQVRSGVSGSFKGLDPYRPSVGMAVGLELSRRSTLGLAFDSHEFYWSSQNDFVHTKLLEVGPFYRYWLNEARKLRPYVNTQIGYARTKLNAAFTGDDFQYNQSKLFGRGGLGVCYRFSPLVGVDLSANADGFYAFRDYDRPESVFFDAQIGLNFFL